MHEVIVLAAIVVAIGLVCAIVYRPFVAVLRAIEYGMVGTSILVILGMMAFVSAEVVMRYGFNSPIPGHLELSELLLLAIVFLAVSYTQRTHGHVGMDLVLDAMSPGLRRRATVLNLAVSIVVCAIIAWFSAKNALQLWEYDDVTMTEPYFRTWPWASTIALGYGLLCLRMIAQLLSIISPDRFPDDTPPALDQGLHQSSD